MRLRRLRKRGSEANKTLTCDGRLLDHLILVVGDVARQAAGQEDPDDLRAVRDGRIQYYQVPAAQCWISLTKCCSSI